MMKGIVVLVEGTVRMVRMYVCVKMDGEVKRVN
jgi:hypothetical protein